MNGLSRTAAVGPRVTLNGKEYQVRGKTNRFYAELEAELLKLRGDPFDLIVEAATRAKLDKDAELLNNVANIVTAKFRNWNTMTYSDYLEFMNSPTGDALTAYHCLREDAPELTYDEVKFWLVKVKCITQKDEEIAEMQALFKAIEVASGEDQLGNSNGQPPVVETLAAEQTGT
jgi:hypothetical protein